MVEKSFPHRSEVTLYYYYYYYYYWCKSVAYVGAFWDFHCAVMLQDDLKEFSFVSLRCSV